MWYVRGTVYLDKSGNFLYKHGLGNSDRQRASTYPSPHNRTKNNAKTCDNVWVGFTLHLYLQTIGPYNGENLHFDCMFTLIDNTTFFHFDYSWVWSDILIYRKWSDILMKVMQFPWHVHCGQLHHIHQRHFDQRLARIRNCLLFESTVLAGGWHFFTV